MPPLSRNPQKKQAKLAALAELRAARKAAEKAAHKAAQQEKHKDVRERIAAMTPEERAAWEAQRMEKRTVRESSAPACMRRAHLQLANHAGLPDAGLHARVRR